MWDQSQQDNTLLNSRQRGGSRANEVRAWREQALNTTLIILAAAAIVPTALPLVEAFRGQGNLLPALWFLASYVLIVAMAVLRGIDMQIRAGLVLLVGYSVTMVSLAHSGLVGGGRVYLVALPVLATILVNERAGLVATALSIVIFGTLTTLISVGWIQEHNLEQSSILLNEWIDAGLSLLMMLLPVTFLLGRFLRFHERTLSAERQALVELEQMAELLEARADELEETTIRQGRQQRAFAVAVDVGRTVSSILEPDQLVRQVVDLVRERFDLYYVGLFLVDERGRYAVLKAGTGKPGQVMRAQGHRLEVGGRSMVGSACSLCQVQLTLDVGKARIRFDNPLLPLTRTEMALPLMVGKRVIGALDVQSRQLHAFSEEDISALQLVADQTAIGLENARLFAETQESLKELGRVYQTITGESWQRYLEAQPSAATAQAGDLADTSEAWTALFDEARHAGHTVVGVVDHEGDTQQALAIPIRFRGVSIGTVGIRRPRREEGWHREDIALAENLADRMALALENARLLEETQQRAWHEYAIRDITDKLTSSLDLDRIMHISLEELGHLANASGGYVELNTGVEQTDAD